MLFFDNYQHRTSHTYSPWVKDVHYGINFGMKDERSRLECIDYWKWFLVHNSFPFTPIAVNLRTQTLHESRMYAIELKVKVKVHWLLKTVSRVQMLSFYTYHHETSHTDSPWVKDVQYRLQGQRLTSQCIDYKRLFPVHNCFPFHMSSWNFTQTHQARPRVEEYCPVHLLEEFELFSAGCICPR